jgi:hypothetical protein
VLFVAALRPPEVGEQNRLSALEGDFADGLSRGAKARVVAHLVLFHWDVEINAYEHALPANVSLIERAIGAHLRLLTPPV